jgi:hypothetical protein
MNFGRADDNRHDWKLGDIVHTAGSYMKANGYNYCGYEEFEIPVGSRAMIIGIKQTDLNKTSFRRGDVYIDFELLDHTNPDGTPITCGNRHAFSMAEVNKDFAFCPDGSGEPGYLRSENMRDAGLWVSLEATQIEDHPEHGYVQFKHRKVVDPRQYTGPGGQGTMHNHLTVASCD